MKDWPNDSDGAVFRFLEERGFDFAESVTIKFKVEFRDNWPPEESCLQLLRDKCGELVIVPPDNSYPGRIEFNVDDKLNYDLVVRIQRETLSLVEGFGGSCDSWSVLPAAAKT